MKKDSAWKVSKFGPITGWSINCDADAVQVLCHMPIGLCAQRCWGKAPTLVPADQLSNICNLNVPATQVLLATSNAEYLCIKPAPGYKKIFAHVSEQAEILFEVWYQS